MSKNEMMNAKEFWISKYPDAEEDWGKTGHDDRFQVRMMEEYAEYRVKNCLIADVVCSSCSDEYAKRWDRYEINLNDKNGTSVDVSVDYCENCGHVYNMCEY